VSKVVQEKFEIRYPQQSNDDPGEGWITDVEARAKKGTPGREGVPGGDSDSRPMNNAAFFNGLPPGMDIEDQEMADIRQMPMNGNGTQITNDITERSLRTGFDRKKMLSTDDMYTREHNDAFYDVVDVDGVEGFVERNNYLDRV